MSATLLPIPSGTWSAFAVGRVDVLSMWVDADGEPVAMIRMPDDCIATRHASDLRLARPDPATTLEGVLAELDTLRESTAWAPSGDPVARVRRELDRILEAARAGT